MARTSRLCMHALTAVLMAASQKSRWASVSAARSTDLRMHRTAVCVCAYLRIHMASLRAARPTDIKHAYIYIRVHKHIT